MENGDFDKFVSRARKKQSLIEDFLAMAEEQAAAIENENYDSILNMIDKKQNIIEQVNLLDLSLPYPLPADNKELQLINKHSSETMSRVIIIEEGNIQSLKTHQARILEKLKNIRINKQLHSAYRGENINMGGILLDKKK